MINGLKIPQSVSLSGCYGFRFLSNPSNPPSYAVSLNGTNLLIQLASQGGVTTIYTILAWIYPTDLGGSGDLSTYGRTVFSGCGAANQYPIWLTVYGTSIRIRSWRTTSTMDTSANVGLAINTWSHVAVTATKGGTTKVYYNGTEVISYSNLNLGTWSSDFSIGAIRPVRSGTIIPFAGYIDLFRIWNTIRTPEEITSTMLTLIPGNSTGLCTYLKLNLNTGTTAVDSTGNAYNGRLQVNADADPTPTWVAGNPNLVTI